MENAANKPPLNTQQLRLRLLLVSGKSKEFSLESINTVQQLKTYLFDNWPSGISHCYFYLQNGKMIALMLNPISNFSCVADFWKTKKFFRVLLCSSLELGLQNDGITTMHVVVKAPLEDLPTGSISPLVFRKRNFKEKESSKMPTLCFIVNIQHKLFLLAPCIHIIFLYG